jgi:hypothetical protein
MTSNSHEFVERLRLYPHALRENIAYYSPTKKALLFGYFQSPLDSGEIVFTCLSNDIVAHETTHALIHGLRSRVMEPTNEDAWALQEAFADIVALFQHFTFPEVLRQHIARVRGSIEIQNLMGELACQFGQTIGVYRALRSALGYVNPQTREWNMAKPDPGDLRNTSELHCRGSIMVAAMFEAFLIVYKRRIGDRLRISTGSSNLLPNGELPSDLVEFLAQEASKTARHFLHMCIRAIDYCPPVDIDFGDYLRALITSDADLVSNDKYGYRKAVIESFRRRGILPRDAPTMSLESLLWHTPNDVEQKAFQKLFGDPHKIRKLVPEWDLTTNRRKIFEQDERGKTILKMWFKKPEALEAAKAAGLVLEKSIVKSILLDVDESPLLQINCVRPTRRIGPEGRVITDLVIEITQCRYGYLDSLVQNYVDRGEIPLAPPDFLFRGGCTLLVDPETALVRYCIYKHIMSNNRIARMQQYLNSNSDTSSRTIYMGDPRINYFRSLIYGTNLRDEALVIPFQQIHRAF